MKKNKNWFFVIVLAVVGLLFVGCSSTPRVLRSQVVYPPVYTYAQEPSKRIIEDGGRQYKDHVRKMQDARFAHEREMVRIEYLASEYKLAREKGVALPVPTAPTVGAFPSPPPPYSPAPFVSYPPEQNYYPAQVVPYYQPQPTVAFMYPSYYYGGGGYVGYGRGNFFGVRMYGPGLRGGGGVTYNTSGYRRR